MRYMVPESGARTVVWAALAMLPPASATEAQGRDEALAVPRAAAPLLDARLAPGEWDTARVVRLGDGTELRLQHDGRFLYVALRATSTGFSSVCASDGDVVHVLHASAALGHAEYQRSGTQWDVRMPFTFGLRTREDTPAARAERDAFLREHGWLGTTMYQGDRMQKELQIPLSFMGGANPRIALAFMRDTPGARTPTATWPARLRDGCSAGQLVRGFDLPHPGFDPAHWVRLTFGG